MKQRTRAVRYLALSYVSSIRRCTRKNASYHSFQFPTLTVPEVYINPLLQRVQQSNFKKNPPGGGGGGGGYSSEFMVGVCRPVH